MPALPTETEAPATTVSQRNMFKEEGRGGEEKKD